MPLISSTQVLGLLSLFRLTTAYLLVTSPSTLLQQNLVHILGSSMRLPSLSLAAKVTADPSIFHPAAASPNPFIPGNPAVAMAALFIAYLALTDLAALNMREELHMAYWTAQAPVRLVGLFALEAFVYLKKPELGSLEESWGSGLCNDLVFFWGFVEATVTFYAWMVLREERGVFVAKMRLEKEKEG